MIARAAKATNYRKRCEDAAENKRLDRPQNTRKPGITPETEYHARSTPVNVSIGGHFKDLWYHSFFRLRCNRIFMEEGATRMLLGKPFAAFVEKSPIRVMVRGTWERVFEPTVRERIFQDHAILGYAKELTFSPSPKNCRESMIPETIAPETSAPVPLFSPDVTAVDTSLLGHSYYGDSGSVLSDFVEVLQDGKPADQRKWLRPEFLGASKYWVFQR